ncbi:MAG: hypothetical protein ABSH44_15465 [Bryobacteraceae bacterium]
MAVATGTSGLMPTCGEQSAETSSIRLTLQVTPGMEAGLQAMYGQSQNSWRSLRSREASDCAMRWILRQWDDIKGNVKYGLLLFILGVIMAGVVAVTHGLALWQQVTLTAFFLVLVAWALLATAAHRAAENRGFARAQSSTPSEFPASEISASVKAFQHGTLAALASRQGALDDQWNRLEAGLQAATQRIDDLCRVDPIVKTIFCSQ